MNQIKSWRKLGFPQNSVRGTCPPATPIRGFTYEKQMSIVLSQRYLGVGLLQQLALPQPNPAYHPQGTSTEPGSFVQPTWKVASADKRVPHVRLQDLDFAFLVPHKRRGRGPHLPRLLYGFNEIIYLESSPGAVKGISHVSYI